MSIFHITIQNVEKIANISRAQIDKVEDVDTVQNVAVLNVVEGRILERLTIRIGPPRRRAGIPGGETMSTVVQITDEEAVDVSYDFSAAIDPAGNPAPIDPTSVVTAIVDHPEIVSVEVSANIVTITSENAGATPSIGQALIDVTVTPPAGDPINDQIAVTVTPSSPTAITGSVGPARPR